MFDTIGKFVCDIKKNCNNNHNHNNNQNNQKDYTSVKFKHKHYDHYYKCYASVEPGGKIIYIECQPWYYDINLKHMKIEKRNDQLYLTKNK